ncbi:MAG: hypothetical protein EAZ95_06400 [Bacteroidetes bacterium]|nr:MAG: hypothetical protein EAZ95_06400 [Bacteroidota bacterium]
MRSFILSLAMLCFSANAYAQLTVMNGNEVTLASVLNQLVGAGVQVENVKFKVGNVDVSTMASATASSAKQMYGLYTFQGTDHPLTKGMIFSTGNAKDAVGSSGLFKSTNKNFGGDAMLSGQTLDAVSIQFDLYPTAPVLYFNYAFASEEYDEYVCTPFNDQFRLLITGPKPSGGVYNNINIAVVPGTPADPISGSLGQNVSINSVNAGGPSCSPPTVSSNVQYFDANGSPHMTFDQRTKNLYAKVPVIPLQKYTLYFVVADVQDRIFDTGVFVEAMNTNIPSIELIVSQSAFLQNNSVVEGMEIQPFNIKRPSISAGTAETFTVETVGTATAGADYEIYEGTTLKTLPFTVDFGANELTKTYTLKIKTDAENEADENLKFNLKSTTGILQSSYELSIKSTASIFQNVNTNLTRCSTSQAVEFEAPQADSYAWDAPVGSYTCLTSDCRKISITSTSPTVTLTCKLGFGNIPASASSIAQVITVQLQSIEVTPNTTLCTNGSVVLQASGATSYQWSPATGLSCTDCANPIASPTQTTTYTVTGTSTQCGNLQKTVTITVTAPTETLTFNNLANTYCVNGSAVTLSASPAGGTFWVNGQSATTFSPTTLGVGTHQIVYRRQDAGNGCLNTLTRNIEIVAQGAVNITASPTKQAIMPNTQVATFSVVATGNTPLAYQWQEDKGTGFANIANGGVYSGANMATLTLTNVPLTFNGYKYRCTVTDCGNTKNSESADLVVSPLSVASSQVRDGVILHPNPTAGKAWIETAQETVTAVEILTLEGKEFAKVRFMQTGAYKYELSLPKMPRGTYLLKVWVGKQFVLKRLVRE